MHSHYVVPDFSITKFVDIFLNHGTHGILLTDAAGRIVAMNKSYCTLFHLLPQNALGRNVLDLVGEGAWSPNVLQRVLRKKQSVSVVQTTHKGNTVLSTGTPVFGDNDKIQYVLFNDRDMSLKALLESDTSSPVEMAIHAGTDTEQPSMENAQHSMGGIVIQNAIMKQQVNLALRVAKFQVPVLLTGESGVGKSMIAKFIHDQSSRRKGPFVAINCGAIPDQLMESELFGHVKGAFTGADSRGKKGRITAADGGTLFLDEISELPYLLQVKLLQFLETKQIFPVGSTKAIPVDCTVIAATNQFLPAMISNRSFRKDLYYRLNGLPISLPPLRERKDEIPILAHYFLEQYSSKFDIDACFTPSACDELQTLPFYGNVRELSHLIQRLIIVAEQGRITAQHVRKWTDVVPFGESMGVGAYTGTLNEQVVQFQKDVIRKTIQRCGSQEKAAKALGVHQSTLSRKL